MLTAVLAAGLTACASRSSVPGTPPAPATGAGASPARLAALIGCLRHVGADAVVSRGRDLRVSGGEVSIAFSTFDAYVGLASGRAEAQQAAEQLDQQLTVLGQAGAANVRGSAVYYYDAALVPAAAGRVVTACANGAQREAARAMATLSKRLPRVEFPAELAASFASACRRLGTAAGCACAYGRATRLYRYGQISDIAARPGGAQLAALMRMCVRAATA